MQCIIKGQAYNYIDRVMEDEFTRNRYFQLSKDIYKLKYEKWYQSGYMDNRYIPYVIMHGDTAVSSVAVCVNDINWKGQQKRYVKNKIICHDIFTDANNRLDDILGIVANDDTDHVCLGFTPELKHGYTIEESQEEDNHLFVLNGKENIFRDNQVMFPMLSRA